MATDPQPRSPADRADQTRTRILEAALREFSAHGLAGARTDQIASAAGVNKALLYYYFENKEKLYIAALETAAGRVRDSSMAAFLREASPGEKLLRVALNHFDRILTQREFQGLMHHEMVRVHKGESSALPILVKRVFAPVHAMFQALVREGIAAGEVVDVDWMQLVLSALGANVFYFLSAPVWRMILPFDPLSPEAIAERRIAAITYLGQAVFVDRERGAEHARRVLADTPLPDLTGAENIFRGNDESTQ